LYLSERAKAFFAISGKRLTPAAWNAHVHREDFPGYRAAIASLFKSRRTEFEHEYRIRKAGGELSWILDRAVVVRDAAGRVTRLVGAVADITQRKLDEIELRRARDDATAALERQTATAEVLASISGSMADTQPVFERIVRNVRRLFGTRFAVLQLLHGDMVEMPAVDGQGIEKLREYYPRPLDATTVGGLAMLSKRALQYAPVLDNPETPPATIQFARDVGFDSVIFTPMIHEGKVIGAIGAAHPGSRPFDDRQVALIKTFADQAVIAIENVRLFNETREALERQTATAEILKVISSSPSDVQPVFDIIGALAERLCVAEVSVVSRFDGELIQLVALHGVGDEGARLVRRAFPMRPEDETVTARAFRNRAVIHIADILADLDYGQVGAARAAGYRGCLGVPMLREGQVIGVIFVARKTPGCFDEAQVELLETFADQAVIAIENVRLFNELQSRTEALTRSVQQLTALEEVGRAISSTLDLSTVLQTIVSRAVQLTGLNGGSIYEFDEGGGEFHLRAAENMPAALVETYRRMPIRLGEGIVGSAAAKREPVQVADIQDPSYQTRYRESLLRQGYRAILAVPLLRDEQIIGALTVSRSEPGAFAPEVIELLKTFAAQSAMAIQNARLFREIEEKGKQLEQASRHKSNFLASMSHELRTPLNAILGFNEMIIGEIYGEVPEDMREPLADIQTSGKHLLRLINNVLDLAKIEAGRMELSLDDYWAQDLVESVVSTLRPLAAEKGLEFLATLPEELPLAYGDGGRITQCLMNLAGNSLKFTKTGKVEISVAAEGGMLVYKVSDTGIGIPPDKIGSLFTEFKQTDATIASEYGGTGLGLSISKKFVEMHGGRIWVESEPGRGSAFIFEIPLRVATT
ncbi:MAG: GAF domain-containing protein, partial [Burkholderiales bacterium]|nr:GAF domain-containing protein [Burkholderiales bacterium]